MRHMSSGEFAREPPRHFQLPLCRELLTHCFLSRRNDYSLWFLEDYPSSINFYVLVSSQVLHALACIDPSLGRNAE